MRLGRHRLTGLGLLLSGLLGTLSASAVSTDVVISQVFGGGGNTGSTYKNDFIELYNRGSTAVSLNGWSVQYASATGTSWQVTNLTNFTLQPGQHYLVQEAAGTGGTTALPTPDATGAIAMSATSGKIALVTSTTALTCGATAASCLNLANVKDSIGYGTASAYEGSPTPALSATQGALRNGGGGIDTDNNLNDFTLASPAPSNSAVVSSGNTPVNGQCGSANTQAFGVAPASNLCAAGAASTLSGTGPWTWNCTGSNGGTTASCQATKSSASPFTIFHMNDVHARLTPHKWVVAQHGSGPDNFEDVGGAAYVAGKMLSLVNGKPTALVLDGGDISEGNPVGDMNCTAPGGQGCSNNSYGNGGMTTFYEILQGKLQAIAGRSGRGIDALVVGNHDVRDISYITNMEHMAGQGVPVISANLRDVSCTTAHPRYPRCEHFPPYTTVTVNGVKVGILGYTTSNATVGASLASTLTVVDCQWTGAASGCNIAPYVNELRNTQGAQIVILLTHDGHGDLIDPTAPVIADTTDAKVPEIAITGHWHTWAETVWQPYKLNYKTLFAESGSYMKYIGEVNVSGTGQYLDATQHILRNSTVTPDPDIQAYVESLKAQFQASAGFPVDKVVGYTSDDLLLDDRMKWWSADEYPWSGNNTAGQWITDAMKWKCDHISWPSGGGCDLAIEAGGGVRSDIPAGAVTYLHVYETFPWADDTYVRISMTGQDLINFLKATNLNAGFSRGLDVTANDGQITNITFNGAPLSPSTVYKVAINNYMLAHPPAGYTWPATIASEADPANGLVRDSLIEFMQTNYATPQTAYAVGGARYHFNGEYAGGYRVVVTMLNDSDSKPAYEDAYIRLLSATPETLGRRGSRQVPSDLVNADGSVNGSHRYAEQQLYRSILGVKKGALRAGDIIEVMGKTAFYGGNPEFVDQEGVYGDGVEFKILGHDESLAKPAYVPSIGVLLTDAYKNHYVKLLAKKIASDQVQDQSGATLKIWDRTGFASAVLPGNVGDILQLTGVVTMESFGSRFRSDVVTTSTASLPALSDGTSRVVALPAVVSAPVTLTANASIAPTTYALSPLADAQVASGASSSNFGTSNNLFIQSSTAAGTSAIERAWLKFDLGGIPAGATISSASMELWNWKSTGVSLPVEMRSSSTDTWTETGITWATQPAPGGVLDTQTLVSGVTSTTYAFNVTSFIQAEYAGDRTASLVLKAVDEALAGAPSYGFDAREFGSNGPVLKVVTQPAATSTASVKLFYRYSADNSTWSAWTQAGATLTTAPYSSGFNFPNGYGYYEFYSVATDNLGHVESTPAFAQTSVRYAAATGGAQSLTLSMAATATVGAQVTATVSASSGLPVTLTSATPGVCLVNGTQVTFTSPGTCTLAADQPGDAGYWLPATTAQASVTVTADSASPRAVPLPQWVLQLLALGLLSVFILRLRSRTSVH